MRKPLLAGILLIVSFVCRAASGEPLVAHEWGTFTALQDDDGTAVGAINADDEPVPMFVHRIGWVSIFPARSQLSPALTGGKGLVPCHPGVTMRLETPMIYFYPPPGGQTSPVDVHVDFRGGWLTEFYPHATAKAPDLTESRLAYPLLKPTMIGSLDWHQVELGASGDLVATDDPVWTAPREVPRAATVKAAPLPHEPGQPDHPEKFLFYRGVGHLNSPLRVVRDGATDRLNLYADLSAFGPPRKPILAADLRVPAAWLLEIRPGDGFCAFRAVEGAMDLRTSNDQVLTSLPAGFSPGEFGGDRLTALKKAMHEALVAAGLFPDEAAAMLKTWELSYFKSPGRRLFYLTPRSWTDEVLPLTIDGATITRAMIGRVELVTPAQHAALARIAAGPCPDMPAFTQAWRKGLSEASAAWNRRTNSGMAPGAEPWKEPTFAEMKLDVPPIYQDFLGLGRFRDALVLNEQKRRPAPALAAFIDGNELQGREANGFALSSFLPGNEHAR